MRKLPRIISDKDYFRVITQEIGCVVCLLFHNRPGVWADAHHPSPGRKRIHDKVALALCPWHHRGVTILKTKQAKEVYGPSLALEKRAFVGRYGTELELYEKQLQLWDEYKK